MNYSMFILKGEEMLRTENFSTFEPRRTYDSGHETTSISTFNGPHLKLCNSSATDMVGRF